MGEKGNNTMVQHIVWQTLISFVFVTVLLFLALVLLKLRGLYRTEWTFLNDIIPVFILAIFCACTVAVCYRLYSPYISKIFAGNGIQWIIAILALGFFLRLAYIILIPTLPVSDFRTYHDFAVNMITNGIYGYGTSPDCYRSPGESFFLYLIYRIVGSTDYIYPKLTQVVLGTLSIAFVYYIAKKTFNKKVGNIAALLMALFPTQIFYTSIIASENLFTFLNLLALVVFVWFKRENRWYYPALFIMGLLMGCAVLVRPVSILLPVIILAILLVKEYHIPGKGYTFDKSEIGKFILAALVLTMAIALVVVPWCSRNYSEYGHFSVSSNGGLAFWVGNNEHATGQYDYAIEPIMADKFGDISGLNDFQREDLLYTDAKQYILMHPLETALLDIKKLFILYGSSSLGIYWSMVAPGTIADQTLQSNLVQLNPLFASLANGFYYFILFMSLLSLPILARDLLKDKNYLALTLIAYIMYFSIMYSISLVDDRYNFNVLPILTILAAYVISKVLWPGNPRSDFRPGTQEQYVVNVKK